jgi:hypothetical protein
MHPRVPHNVRLHRSGTKLLASWAATQETLTNDPS